MQILPIELRNRPADIERVISLRAEASVANRKCKAFRDAINTGLVSPDSGERYQDVSSELVCKDGKSIPIVNGIPDFTIFSKEALDEKQRQAEYHDDEEVNERFDEVVLRPYNYTKFHAKIWLKHLYVLGNYIETSSGKQLKNLKILNCGCGGGFEAQFLAEQGATVVGFDISQLRAEASATRFLLNNLDGFFYRGDAAILPFEDNYFDVVLYHDSLHHVPIEEIPKAIYEARRVTKKLVVLSEAHDSPLRMILESFGHSISIESSGNYTFRFRKSIIQFWCYRFGMKLKLYRTSFQRKEHRPNLYAKPIIGRLAYYLLNVIGFFLSRLGNEALIIMEKEKQSKYLIKSDKK
jgi:ubiquinone/menaquinone biosynthesis C-methylase UbiE